MFFMFYFILICYLLMQDANALISRRNIQRKIVPRSSLPRSSRGSGDAFGGGGGGSGGSGISMSSGSLGGNDGNGDSKLASGFILFLSQLLDQYSGLLKRNPYTTKIITSGIVGSLGDILIQNWERRINKNSFDFRRLFVFFLVTAFYIAPVIHVWFDILNKMPMPAGTGNALRAGFMMIVDQTVGAVVITIGFFYAFELVTLTLLFLYSSFFFLF